MDSVIKVGLLVVFVIICVLLVLLVLVQDQDNSGMGGLLGGGNSTAFGSHSATVLTKATVVFTVLFFIVTFAIAKILPTKSGSTDADIRAAAQANGVVIQESNVDSNSSDGTKWWNKSSDNKEADSASAENETAPVSEEIK